MATAAPDPRRGGRQAALGLLVVTLIVVVGAAALSVYTCNATYNCPANGCGNVPQENCNSATHLAWEVLLVGAPTAAAAFAAFLWLRRPHGGVPTAVPA